MEAKRGERLERRPDSLLPLQSPIPSCPIPGPPPLCKPSTLLAARPPRPPLTPSQHLSLSGKKWPANVQTCLGRSPQDTFKQMSATTTLEPYVLSQHKFAATHGTREYQFELLADTSLASGCYKRHSVARATRCHFGDYLIFARGIPMLFEGVTYHLSTCYAMPCHAIAIAVAIAIRIPIPIPIPTP